MGEIAGAIAALRRATSLDPNLRPAWIKLGDLLTNAPQLRCLVTCRMHFSLAPYGYALEVSGLRRPQSTADPLEDFEAYRLFRDRALACNPPPT